MMIKQIKPYHTILFDLDGTLVDSYQGIAGGVCYALEKMGRRIPAQGILRLFIGPPLGESFMKHCGMNQADSAIAISYYRDYYSHQGMFEMAMYEGISEMLLGLKASGKRLAVATSKPQPFAVKILESLNLATYFDVIAGSGLDGSLSTKAAVIDHCLLELGCTNGDDKTGVLMVGDREHDVLGAAALAIDCLGVLFGFGSLEELEEAGAIGIVQSPLEVLNYIIGV